MARVPSAPLHFDHKDVLIAIEAEYGVDTGLTFVPVRLWDVSYTPLEADEKELPYVSRFMGNKPAEMFSRRSTLTAKLGLIGHGGAADGIPMWDAFARLAGCARKAIASTPEATIAAATVRGATTVGAFTFTRTHAHSGLVDRVVTLTCATAGDSGVATFTVSSPAAPGAPAVHETDRVMTEGTVFGLADGATITPTEVTTPFAVGDTFAVALTAPGVAYTPLSERTSHASAAVRIILPDPTDGKERVHRMLGARGSLKISGSVNDYPHFEISLTSLFTVPALENETAAVDYSDWPDPIEVSTDNTPVCSLHGHDLVAEQFGVDFGNTAELVERVGRKDVRINDRKSTANLKLEETGLDEFNILAAVSARTAAPLVIQHGVAAGEIVRFEAPRAQLGKPSWSDSKKDLMTDVSMRLLPIDGDDEWRLFVPA